MRTCGRLGCEKPATYVIKNPFDIDIYRCTKHAQPTMDVYVKFENRTERATRMVKL